MYKIIVLALVISIFSNALFGQYKENPMVLNTKTGAIHGTLLVPETSKKVPIALIIAGSGPTDRNGNSLMTTNNSLKMLAENLGLNGIASLRFDKRGIGESKNAGISESDLRFEDYINDVKAWCKLLKKDSRFSDLIIIGHSEGSLIGMIASQEKLVTKFISIAGAGFPAADILRRQLEEQPLMVLEMSVPILEKLKRGEIENHPPQILYALFRPSVQPYLISWFKYNPQTEISKLKMPILIIQGSTDIQTTIEDAENLSKSNKNAQKVIIEKMNHVLKTAEFDRIKNIETYNNPELPINAKLVTETINFIKGKKA